MSNTKTTKRALLSSVLALILCVTMFTGTTFAWFTDTVSSGVNSIVAGNLDIEVEFSDDGASWADLNGTDSLFSTDKWEPGHTEVVYLKITNAGTLALNYKVMVTPVSENGGVNVNGQAFKLSDYLVFGTTAPSATLTTYTRDQARAAVAANGTGLNVNRLTKTGTMAGKTTDTTDVQYLALVVYMPEDIGNEANYKTGTAAPTIELGIKVLATQRTAENDSFGSDYDEDAVNTPFYRVGSYYDYYPQVSVSAPVAQSGDTVITATGKLNSTDTVDTILAKVTVPEGAALVAGTTELTVNVVPKDPEAATTNGTALVTEINNPDRETANFDVKVVGIASSNTANIDVEIFVGKGLANVKVYHNGALISGTSYDPSTGIVTFTTTSFSDYTVAYDVAVAAIGDKTYGSLKLAVDAAQNGETVTLLKDVELDNAVVVAADKEITLDLNGKSIIENGTGARKMVNRGTLTIKDSATGGEIRNTAVGEPGQDGAYGLIDNYGTLSIENGIFTDVAHGNGSSLRNRPGATLIINGGTFTNTADDSQKQQNGFTGAANAFIYSDGEDVRIHGGTFTMTHAMYTPAIKIMTGTGTIDGATISTYKSGGVEVGGEVTIRNTNISVSETNSYYANAIAVSNDGVVNVYSGSFTGYSYGTYIYSSGGIINIYGGTFEAGTAVLKADKDVYAPYNSEINVFGGNFTGKYSIASEARMTITGGTFSSDPSAYVPEGYTVVQEENTYKILRGVMVSSETSLREMLAAGLDVIFTEDISVTATTGGYKNAGVVLSKGGMIDGNGKKLTVSNANGTWDCGVYTTGGTIKNLTIRGPFRGVFGSGAGQDVVIENCDIDAVYPFNHDGSSSYSLIVKNSVLHGWTSYGSIKAAHFIETKFSLDNSGYDCVAAYTDTFFTDCTFDEDFVVYAQVTGFTFNFENCVKDGVSVTAENFKTLFPDDSDVWTKCTCIVNGVTVTP